MTRNKRKNKSGQQNDPKKTRTNSEGEESDGSNFSINRQSNSHNSTTKTSQQISELQQAAAALNKDNLQLSDIGQALSVLINSQIATLEETSVTNQKITSINKTLNDVKIAVSSLQAEQVNDRQVQEEKNIKMSNDILKNRADINFILQSKIDNDVFIGGFTEKPDELYATEEFCKYYKIPRNSIKRAYSYETSSGNAKKGVLIIQFHSKSDQLFFREKKKEIGLISVNQLTENQVSENKNKNLLCINRLSSTNQEIIKRLRDMLKDEKIIAIKYRNCFFYIQQTEKAAFIPVPSLEFLDEFEEASLWKKV